MHATRIWFVTSATANVFLLLSFGALARSGFLLVAIPLTIALAAVVNLRLIRSGQPAMRTAGFILFVLPALILGWLVYVCILTLAD